MDLNVLVGTCVTIFLAELGDKTQLAVFGGAATTRKPIEVFIGASVGLLAATALGVFLGQALGHAISPRVLRIAGAVLFIGIGLWLLATPNA